MYGPAIIRNPAGSFSFVGTFPICLAYTMADGSPLTSDLARGIARCGPGIFRPRIRTVTFASVDDALTAAKNAGLDPETIGRP